MVIISSSLESSSVPAPADAAFVARGFFVVVLPVTVLLRLLAAGVFVVAFALAFFVGKASSFPLAVAAAIRKDCADDDDDDDVVVPRRP
jgi:hypothetical protein